VELGLQIKLGRVKKKLTQQDLAELIGKTRPLVSNIEKTGKVSIYTLKSICEVLDLDFEEMSDLSYGTNQLRAHDQQENQQQNRIKELEDLVINYKMIIDHQNETIEFLRNQLKRKK